MLFAYSFAFCQENDNGCEYDYNKKDEFNGGNVKYTSIKLNTILQPGLSFTLIQSVLNNDTFFFIKVYASGYADFKSYIDKGNELMVKFTNDSIIKLPSIDRYTIDFYMSGSNSVKYINATYRCTRDQMMCFASYALKVVRIEFNNIHDDREIKESKSEDLKMHAVCILI